ncbi:MEDS domain-containing protein [Peribacillus sp. SCS-37]|uniref:MEDS domain-containing protein n=1 Tax=Paraperibacillus esterisolvens TaxID=3115296 RepID=UPI00390661D4
MLENILAYVKKEDYLRKIHFKNNFDFYFQQGDFHIPSIIEDFRQTVQSITAGGTNTIRTWAHVEWGNEQEIMEKITDYEKKADKLVQEDGLLSICAYHSIRTPASMQDVLENCHDAVFH